MGSPAAHVVQLKVREVALQFHEKEKGAPGAVTPDYSPGTWEGEAGRLPEVQGQPGLYTESPQGDPLSETCQSN